MGSSDAPQASENKNPFPEATAEGDGLIKVETVEPIVKEEESSNTGTEGDEPAKEKKEGTEEEKPKLHTCGSQRKRFKWFISQGYEYDDASELAKNAQKYRELRAAAEGRSLEVSERDVKLAQQRKTFSRVVKRKYSVLREHGYSEEEAVALAPTLIDDPGSRQKHLKSDDSNRSGDAVRMIIVMPDYPRTVLTEDQAKLVKDAILKLVVEKTSKTRPQFTGCNFSKGYLIFDCCDQQTITWIQQRARELALWEGCALRAISEKALKDSDMFMLKLADAEQDTDEDISNFLNKQNDGIDTTKWLFVARKFDEQSKTVELTLKLDPHSAKTLHERDYKLNYKFEQVTAKRITVDLFDSESKPAKKSIPPNRRGGGFAPQRRPYRGGAPQNRFGNGYNYYSNNQLNRNVSFEQRQQNFIGGGGDYIDGLLNQLNRSLFGAIAPPQNNSFGGFGGGFPYGRGGRGRGAGGYRNFNPRQRFS